MGGKHVFPSNVYKFIAWAENFELQCTGGRVSSVLHLPELAERILHQQIINLKDTQQAVNNGGDTAANYMARDYARKQLEDNIRNIINEFVNGNPNITPTMLKLLKLNVPDLVKTPIHVPNIVPDIEVDFATPRRHFVHFGRIGTKNKIVRGLPKGATGVQVWRCIGGEIMPDISEFEFVGEVSRSPFQIDYEDAMFAQKIWYAVRYYNFKHEFGPWSLKKVALVN